MTGAEVSGLTVVDYRFGLAIFAILFFVGVALAIAERGDRWISRALYQRRLRRIMREQILPPPAREARRRHRVREPWPKEWRS